MKKRCDHKFVDSSRCLKCGVEFDVLEKGRMVVEVKRDPRDQSATAFVNGRSVGSIRGNHESNGAFLWECVDRVVRRELGRSLNDAENETMQMKGRVEIAKEQA